ncbi:MAG: hypothetical protein PG981_000961 [Wolbachia endosymbiont of Ctenocephalides orientis wCori]|nr:MAG: hypothetical protein PG981_000961 [Wolbachia endosymbiont of Ctenocephalides orientis wCori]
MEGQVKTGKDTVASLKTEEDGLRKSIQELEEKQQKLQNEALNLQKEKEAPKAQDLAVKDLLQDQISPTIVRIL